MDNSGHVSLIPPVAKSNATQMQTREGYTVDIGSGTPTMALNFENNKASFADQGQWMENVIKNIQKRYGNKGVNVIAHSMGGNATNTYIIDYDPVYRSSNGTDSVINTFVTLGTPFWGAGDANIIDSFIPMSGAPHDLQYGSYATLKLHLPSNKLPSNVRVLTLEGYGRHYGLRYPFFNEGDGVVSVSSAIGVNAKNKVHAFVDGFHINTGNWYSINDEKDNVKIIMDFIYYNQNPMKTEIFGLSATKEKPIE